MPQAVPALDRAPDETPEHRQAALFALLSHEIRTPLNGVLGMAGLLASTQLDATQTAYLQTLRECGEHLLGLVNDVLDFAKLGSGRIELEPAPTDVEHLLQGVCELLSPRAHAQGLEIAWAVGADVPQILADDGRLRQILFNLMGNAVKMTPRGGVLATAVAVVGAGGGQARLRFAVEDTGPGLQPEDAGRIFRPFVQARAGERAGGAGLGLAVVKQLADAFEGRVGVDSAPGEGARFWFEADFAVAAARPRHGALPPVRVAIRTQSATLRQAATLQLQACGARVTQGAAAAEVVLQDWRPGAAPEAAPTLALLAPEDRGQIEPLRAAGYVGYLIKPLRRASVAERVRAALDERSAADASRTHAALTPSPDERAASDRPGAGLRVLLAEDNAVNALLARAMLTRSGCGVDRVGTGEEALCALGAGAYDLVLMDMRMPGLSGPEATRAIRATGCRTPIVALTANAFDDDRRACLDAGMDDFLTKPLDPAALDALLARLRPVTT